MGTVGDVVKDIRRYQLGLQIKEMELAILEGTPFDNWSAGGRIYRSPKPTPACESSDDNKD
jgi:hypothetical protein